MSMPIFTLQERGGIECQISCFSSLSTYPLTAPPVVPLAMYFWMKKPMTIMGTIVSVAAALLFPQSTEIEPTNFEIPTIALEGVTREQVLAVLEFAEQSLTVA
jgi:hypothetical protein